MVFILSEDERLRYVDAAVRCFRMMLILHYGAIALQNVKNAKYRSVGQS